MVSIDTSQIPADMLNNPSVLEAKRQLLAIQNDPNRRKQSSVHESAHEYGCRKFGIKTTWAGPRIHHALNQDGKSYFVPICAMVCPEGLQNLTSPPQIGAILCGGYAAEIALCGESIAKIEKRVRETTFDDGSDFAQFVRFSKTKQFSEYNINLFIQTVEFLITKIKQDPQIHDGILQIAEQFERKVYKVFTDPSNEAPTTGGSAPQS